MAKEKGEKTSLYLLSIVAIVAIVGVVVLILNSGAGSVSLSSDDLSGQAIAMTLSGSSNSLTPETDGEIMSVGSTSLKCGGGQTKTCCQRTNDGCKKYCCVD